MSAIQKVTGPSAMAVWTNEQRDLIKRTVAKDATDDELALFLHVAKVSELDPLRRQIHFIKQAGRVYFVADVNGLQARAAREDDYEGLLHAVVYEGDDFAVDNVTGMVVKHTSNPLASTKTPVGAWATVYRRGMKPFTSVVRFVEYLNPNNALWRSKPAVMIDKCAKSTALRLAYPEQLGSIYEEAELGKDEKDVTPQDAAPSTPPKTAKEAQAQLAALRASKVEDAQVVVPTPWQRVLDAGHAAGMQARHIGKAIRERTGKEKTSDLTQEDADAFIAWLEDMPPEEPAETAGAEVAT